MQIPKTLQRAFFVLNIMRWADWRLFTIHFCQTWWFLSALAVGRCAPLDDAIFLYWKPMNFEVPLKEKASDTAGQRGSRDSLEQSDDRKSNPSHAHSPCSWLGWNSSGSKFALLIYTCRYWHKLPEFERPDWGCHRITWFENFSVSLESRWIFWFQIRRHYVFGVCGHQRT